MNTTARAMFAFALLAVCVPALAADTPDPVRDALRERIEMLKASDAPEIDGAPIAAARGIAELYERRGYEPAWTERRMVKELYDAILRSVEHGLNPEDFHAAQIGRRFRAAARLTDPADVADSEILFTDALARLAVTIHFGKLDPAKLDPAWNLSRKFAADDPVKEFAAVLDSREIAAAFERAEPTAVFYDDLKRTLVAYREIKSTGGWPTVPGGDVLKRGSKGPRVATLRERLHVTGDLGDTNPVDPQAFDQELETAVKRFQGRHGIAADGKVGKGTIQELNLPVEDRIDQLRAAMERVRWVFRDIPGDFVIVDIAGYILHLFRNGEHLWQTRVQVGKPFHATPVFRDDIRYMEINPTWTIPPGILRRSTLPAIRKDPGYLQRSNMTVLTTSGQKVDPSTIDWAATATKGFPYMIRQEPGPQNALGRVKFMFPNKYMVYLHDTPSKGLFARTERAFSSGCIRVQDPFKLAELLLENKPGWDRAKIDSVLESKKTTRVNLVEPMPVLILYWTAQADPDGTVHFRKDLYGRDAKIIAGLEKPFLVAPPQGTLSNPG